MSFLFLNHKVTRFLCFFFIGWGQDVFDDILMEQQQDRGKERKEN